MPDTPSQAAYRAFCATAPDVPLFAQPWYLDACAEGGRWDAVLALENGQPVAALPFFFHSLVSDLVYCTVLFGGFALAQRQVAGLRQPVVLAA